MEGWSDPFERLVGRAGRSKRRGLSARKEEAGVDNAGTLLFGRRSETENEQKAPGELALLAVAVRWAGVALATMAVVGGQRRLGGNARVEAVAIAGLLVWGIVRTVWPAGSGGLPRIVVPLVAETVALEALAAATGGWSSPLLLQMGAVVLISGLIGGLLATEAVVAAVAVVAGIAALAGVGPVHVGEASSVAAELVVVAGLGVFARRMVLRRSGNTGEEIARLRRAAELNGVLLELYAKALGEPGSLGVEAAIGEVVRAVEDAFLPDAFALLLEHRFEQGASRTWDVVARSGLEGVRGRIGEKELPELLEAARQTEEVVVDPGGLKGFGPPGASALAVALSAGGQPVGLLGVARGPEGPPFSSADAEALGRLARHGAVALDNGRWIDRLRQLGADAERDRIARELHDRVGQSLAAVSLSLDRLVELVPDTGLEGGASRLLRELERSAGEVRSLLREVRETLSELRSGPSKDRDLVSACRALCARVRERSGVEARCSVSAQAGGLGSGAERELWWIVHEAVVNAERHAKASLIEVRLALSARELVAVVVDDGIGIGALGSRPEAFGLRGMRERAELLGASLRIVAPSGGGTMVEVRAPRRWP